MLYMRGVIPAGHILLAVYGQLKLPTPMTYLTNSKLADIVIQGCLMDLFNASDPQNQSNKSSKGRPLGALAEHLTMALTDSEDMEKVIWACDAISMVPVLNVYGQISEMYIAIKKSGVDELWNTGH
jgi:hypothetical protein